MLQPQDCVRSDGRIRELESLVELVGKAKAKTGLTHQLEVWASEEAGRVSGGSVICTELPNSLILPNLLYMHSNPHYSSGGGRIQIVYFQWK